VTWDPRDRKKIGIWEVSHVEVPDLAFKILDYPANSINPTELEIFLKTIV